jgi:hypothetical protein
MNVSSGACCMTFASALCEAVGRKLTLDRVQDARCSDRPEVGGERATRSNDSYVLARVRMTSCLLARNVNGGECPEKLSDDAAGH